LLEDQAEPPAQDEVTPELDQPKTDPTVDADASAVPDTQKRQAKKNSSLLAKAECEIQIPESKQGARNLV
jgi:hypothetical protein